VDISNHYTTFLETITNNGKDIVLFAIPCDHDVHPVATEVSTVFVRDVSTKITYHFSWKHGDETPLVSKEKFCQDISSIKNRKWVFDKKSFVQMLPVTSLLDANLYKFLNDGSIIDFSKFETMSHRLIYRSLNGNSGLNNIVPILKHQEMFDAICNEFHPGDTDSGYLKHNEIIIDTLAEVEQNGINIDEKHFLKYFKVKIPKPNTVYSQYNIYTSTGRPSNHYDGVNYAALKHNDGVRNSFTSRYGKNGKMVLVDYSAFHPRIICNLIKFPLSIDIDIYKYLGEMYFGRTNLGSYELDEAKKLTFRQLYGGVEEQFEHIKYFSKLKSFINSNWDVFLKNGYVMTPIFKRKITNMHVLDPNPSKLFNYILQATETEIAVQVLKSVGEYLKGKKSKAVIYTYDSILFDFHKEDGASVLKNVMTIMKMGGRFPIKVYLGETYDSVSQIYPR